MPKFLIPEEKGNENASWPFGKMTVITIFGQKNIFDSKPKTKQGIISFSNTRVKK